MQAIYYLYYYFLIKKKFYNAFCISRFIDYYCFTKWKHIHDSFGLHSIDFIIRSYIWERENTSKRKVMTSPSFIAVYLFLSMYHCKRVGLKLFTSIGRGQSCLTPPELQVRGKKVQL